jgi:uncharacterized pyridoxamine 5'-phosphate oxidase family protein
MEEIIKFLTDNKVFYLATVDGDQARVRPMGFVMNYEGKLSFCTNNKKDMYRQMKARPNIEICAASPEGKTLRVTGKAVFNPAREAKVKALEIRPNLKGMYSADDGVFEVFYFESGVATFSDMQGNKREVKL